MFSNQSGISGVRQKTENGQTRLVMDYRSKGGVDTATFAKIHDDMALTVKKKYDDKIEGSAQKMAALKEVGTAIDKILDKLSVLRGGYSGPGQETKNIFSSRYVNVQNKNGADSKIYLDCRVEPTVAERELSLSIEQLASKDKTVALGDEGYPAYLKTALNLAGTLKINGKEVAIEPGMTLDYIYRLLKLASREAKFDVFLDTLTPETPSAGGEYSLQLRATEEGVPLTLSEDEKSTVLSGLHIKESGRSPEQLGAKMTIDGMAITRRSNKISDAVTGFHFVLMQDTTGLGADYLTVKAEKNLVGIRDAVLQLVEEIEKFYVLENKYCARDVLGQPLEGALLAGDRSIEKLCQDLSDFIRGPLMGGAKEDLKIGSELGFSLKRQTSGAHAFSFDADKLVKILMSHPEKLEPFFALTCVSSSPSFEVVHVASALSPLLKSAPTQLKVWKDRAAFKTGSADWVEATMSGGRISGNEGTIYDSFRVLLLGSLDKNLDEVDSFLETTLTLKQGKADELAVRLSQNLGGQTRATLEREQDTLKEKRDKEIREIEKKRDDMVQRFGKVHQMAAKYEEVKKLLEMQEQFFQDSRK